MSLLCSGFAAGVGISASLLTEAFLHQRLPDASWTPLVTSFGYCVGFVIVIVIVIVGNLQLFTQNTITVVLPVAVKPSLGNCGRLGRLWG